MAAKRSVLEGLQEYAKRLKATLQTSERITEENTKARFVNPLLKILGWDPELGDELTETPYPLTLDLTSPFSGFIIEPNER